MSADNRLCVMCPHFDHQWYVWEGSASEKYHTPPENAVKFQTKEEALKYAFDLESKDYFEYGVSEINDAEIIEALRCEIDDLKNPIYCPTCGACGEEGCCPPSMCEHMPCVYGDRYKEDYKWMLNINEKMYEKLRQLDPDGLSKIYDEVYTNTYSKKDDEDEQLTFDI
jgi:hypothetical protein